MAGSPTQMTGDDETVLKYFKYGSLNKKTRGENEPIDSLNVARSSPHLAISLNDTREEHSVRDPDRHMDTVAR